MHLCLDIFKVITSNHKVFIFNLKSKLELQMAFWQCVLISSSLPGPEAQIIPHKSRRTRAQSRSRVVKGERTSPALCVVFSVELLTNSSNEKHEDYSVCAHRGEQAFR